MVSGISSFTEESLSSTSPLVGTVLSLGTEVSTAECDPLPAEGLRSIEKDKEVN